MKRIAIITALALVTLAGIAPAKNVDLVTLPNRDTVTLTIYNSEDITLVKETRHLTFKRGTNRMQFSWAGTLIDPSSVEFRPLAHAGEIELADTMYPGQKPQHLIWNIESTFEGQVPVEVSYFTSGITWSMDYVAVTDAAEERVDFTGHVRVFNNSGEEYENAEIRLIVGNIHLVEKIADLARRRGIPVPQPSSPQGMALARDASAEAFGRAQKMAGDRMTRKEVVKEGLSEYFMFTVEGTETIANGWSKRMPAVHGKDSSFDIVYRMRAHQYGPRPVRFFIWRNDEEHKLGDSPLPDGKIRLFRKNGADGLSFLGEQLVRYVPVKAPIEVNLGPDDLVVYETRRLNTRRKNFAFYDGRVSGWDEVTTWTDQIRNYRTKPITVELRRQWSGHIDLSSEVPTTLFDYQTIEVELDVAARSRQVYPATVVLHQGANASQARIELK
jgi:hypothetical protein